MPAPQSHTKFERNVAARSAARCWVDESWWGGSGKHAVDRQPPSWHRWFGIRLLALTEQDRLIG